MVSILICLYSNMAAIIPTFVLLINSWTNIVVVWSISVWSNTIPLWATRKKDFYWMVISVAHLLIILLTFKNNIVWLLTISPTDDISVYESNSMYHVWVYYNQQFYTLERKISNAEPFFCLSLKDLLKYWKVKKIK